MSTFETKYKVLSQIGEGSFSTVLKCEHKVTGQKYAAKKLRKAHDSEASVENCAEIIAARKLPFHINLTNLLEYHYDPLSKSLVLIFELMDMSMYEFLKLRNSLLPEHKVKNYLYQILKGLGHLHKNGFFHRDVKPENILIQLPSIIKHANGHAAGELIKLADLGSIRGIYSSPPYTEYISTRWYRSPECLLTIGDYGSKMDVWATGCVFYEMFTLKPIFPGANEIDQLAKIHDVFGSPSSSFLNSLKSRSRNCITFPKNPGTGLDSIVPNLSPGGKNILKLMLEYDPEKRASVRRILKEDYFKDLKIYKLEKIQRKMSPVSGYSDPGNSKNTTRRTKDLLNVRNKKLSQSAQDITNRKQIPKSKKSCKSDGKPSMVNAVNPRQKPPILEFPSLKNISPPHPPPKKKRQSAEGRHIEPNMDQLLYKEKSYIVKRSKLDGKTVTKMKTGLIDSSIPSRRTNFVQSNIAAFKQPGKPFKKMPDVHISSIRNVNAKSNQPQNTKLNSLSGISSYNKHFKTTSNLDSTKKYTCSSLDYELFKKYISKSFVSSNQKTNFLDEIVFEDFKREFIRKKLDTKLYNK